MVHPSAPTKRLGTLWLVPNALDLGVDEPPALDLSLPRGVIERSAAIEHWVVENAKTARAFIKRVAVLCPLARPLQSLDIRELPRPPKDGRGDAGESAWAALLAPALAGHDVGLLSEAGLPAVADPGSRLVAQAHAVGIPVVPLPGPSAITLALAASGLNGQSFSFVGYLPTEAAARSARIRALEAVSRRERQTHAAIETPYRNAALAGALIESLHPDTRLAIACGVTLPGGWCRMSTVADWRREPPRFDAETPPAVFLWLAG